MSRKPLNFVNKIRSSLTKKNVLLGSGILLGLTTPTLLSDEFAKYGLKTHDGNKNCREIFESKFGNKIRMHQYKPLLYSMIGINIAIYGFWKINPQLMHKHFLCNLENIQAKRFEFYRNFKTDSTDSLRCKTDGCGEI